MRIETAAGDRAATGTLELVAALWRRNQQKLSLAVPSAPNNTYWTSLSSNPAHR
jgi:hypothetical protein